MNISYNWLKRYLPTELPAGEIARILTDIGLEVEGFEKIETVRGGLQGVVVAEVLTCTDHPDSDHLHLTTVDVGSGEPLQIVCGAPNCRAGLKVLCATVGAVLYPGGGGGGVQNQAVEDPRRRVARHALRRGRAGYRHGARRHHGAAFQRSGGHGRPGVPAYRGRLPDSDRTDAQPRGCGVAYRRGARPGGLPPQPRRADRGAVARRLGLRSGQPRPAGEDPCREHGGRAPAMRA